MDIDAINRGVRGKKTKEVIKSCCGDVMLQKFLSHAEKCGKNELRIVNTGLVSSGKSSLFNVIMDRFQNERFPTGAARTTVEGDSELFEKDVYLVDTPGIDVKDADDRKAFDVLTGADIILFVHNVKLGELRREEVHWLENIRDNILKDYSRLIFVCSWIDERDGDEDYPKTLDKINSMVRGIFSSDIDICCVSSKRYIAGAAKTADGKKKAGEALIEKSGICELKDILHGKIQKYSSQSAAQEIFRKDCEDIMNMLYAAKKQAQDERQRIEERVRGRYSSKRNLWKDIFSQYQVLKRDVDRINKEIANL